MLGFEPHVRRYPCTRSSCEAQLSRLAEFNTPVCRRFFAAPSEAHTPESVQRARTVSDLVVQLTRPCFGESSTLFYFSSYGMAGVVSIRFAQEPAEHG